MGRVKLLTVLPAAELFLREHSQARAQAQSQALASAPVLVYTLVYPEEPVHALQRGSEQREGSWEGNASEHMSLRVGGFLVASAGGNLPF